MTMTQVDFDKLPLSPTFEIYLANPDSYKPKSDFLFYYIEEESALTHAVKVQNSVAVAGLLCIGADPNQVNLKGVTPISLAAYRGCTEIMILLIHAGADVNYLNSSGSTPLIQAAHFGHADAVRILLEYNAKADFANSKGTTALMRVSQEGHVDIGKLLIAAGADVNRRNNEGMNSLMLASQRGHANVAALLIDFNASIDEQTTQGSTALMLASKRGHTACVEVLLARGAELSMLDRRHRSAKDTALKRNQLSVLPLLCQSFQMNLIQRFLQDRRTELLMRYYDSAEACRLKLAPVPFVSLQLLLRFKGRQPSRAEYINNIGAMYSGFMMITEPSTSRVCRPPLPVDPSFGDDMTDDCDGSLNDELQLVSSFSSVAPDDITHPIVSNFHINGLFPKGLTSLPSSRPSSAVSAHSDVTCVSPLDALHALESAGIKVASNFEYDYPDNLGVGDLVESFESVKMTDPRPNCAFEKCLDPGQCRIDDSLYMLNPFPEAMLSSSVISTHATHSAFDITSADNFQFRKSLLVKKSGFCDWQWPLILHRCMLLPRGLFELIVEFLPPPPIWKWSLRQLQRRIILAPREAVVDLCGLIDEIIADSSIFKKTSQKLLMVELNRAPQIHQALIADWDLPPSVLQSLCAFSDVQSLLGRTLADELTFRLPLLRRLWSTACDLLRWQQRHSHPVWYMRSILASCVERSLPLGKDLLHAFSSLSQKQDATMTRRRPSALDQECSDCCHPFHSGIKSLNASQSKDRSLFEDIIDYVSENFGDLEEDDNRFLSYYESTSSFPDVDDRDGGGRSAGAGGALDDEG